MTELLSGDLCIAGSAQLADYRAQLIPWEDYTRTVAAYGLLHFNAGRGIGADLTVVKMRGWDRHMWYDETGLEWVNPSPNMRSLNAAALYPGVGLLETTNVSVGRGTATPFEVLGAPWIDGRRLAACLSARRLPGVRLSPVHFTPDASVFAGQLCGGLRFTIWDREALKPVALGIEIASALRSLYPVAPGRSRRSAPCFATRRPEALRGGRAVERS
jgi:uncharacterized protein YbbC (DUF1343 family)